MTARGPPPPPFTSSWVGVLLNCQKNLSYWHVIKHSKPSHDADHRGEAPSRGPSSLGLSPSVVLHSLSCVRLFVTPWTAACEVFLSFTISWSLLKLMSVESVLPSNHLICYCPLLFLPLIFPSIRVFPMSQLLRIRWPKYWSFSFSISPSNEYSGLISFWIDWFDLLAVQETLKSLLQPHRSKASILWCSAFLCSNSHTCTWLLEKAWLWLYGPLLAKWYLCFLIHCLGVSYLFFQWASFF